MLVLSGCEVLGAGLWLLWATLRGKFGIDLMVGVEE